MNKKRLQIAASMLVVLGLVVLTAFGCNRDEAIQARGVTNLSSLHLQDDTGTATPVFLANQTGSGRIMELQDGGTVVAYVDDGGAVAFTGSITHSGAETFNAAVKVAATPAASATPQLMIQDVGAGVPFEVRNAAGTPVAAVEGDYDWDLFNNSISNIGAAGTDFSETGGLTLADALTVTSGGATITAGGLIVTAGGITITAGGLDMTADAITNIGNAGTDFSASGGLTLAAGLIVTTGGVDIVAGGLTLENDETIVNTTNGIITATVGASQWFAVATGNLKVGNGTPGETFNGEDAYIEGSLEVDGSVYFDGAVDMDSTLDMSAQTISNIGNAGTDFGSDGSLTTASTITVTAGGLVVTAGGVTVTAGGLDMTNDAITNIGNAGTDFGADGSLTTASWITATAGGIAMVAGAVDLNGTGFDLDVTAAVSIDADAASNISLSAQDLTIEAETGSITIKGDEAVADAVLIDANDTVTTGLTINVGSVSGVTISGGGLNMSNSAITNIGAAGTDFSATGGLTLADGLTITTGGATVTAGGITVSDGDVVVADDLRITAQTAITVTNAAVFTPTGTYQRIQAAAEVTPTMAIGIAGDLLMLINVSDQIINLADSGTMMLTTAWEAGQYDTLTLLCDGTNWLEISRANN